MLFLRSTIGGGNRFKKRIKMISLLSPSLRLMSFVAALAVVLMHAIAITNVSTSDQLVVLINYFVHATLLQWAVPFFFVCSGYWFAMSSYIRGGEVHIINLYARKSPRS